MMIELKESESGPLFFLSQFLGASEPALRLLFSILLGYPIAYAYKCFLPDKPRLSQHIYFILCGLSLGYYNFGFEILHTTANLIVVFIILKLFGGTLACAITVLAFNMMYLLVGYYYTETDAYDIIWTMPHCILVLRLSGLAFDIYDGHQPEAKLSKDSKILALRRIPSFIEIAAYTYFPTSFLVGPQYSFRRYQDFMEGKLADASDDSYIKAALNRAGLGFLYLVLYVVGKRFYSDDYLLGDDYSNLSFVRRCFILGLWAHITLYKYVSCWLICEGSCILTGLTYNGKDEQGKSKWDGCSNIKVLLFESASNFNRDYIHSFNVNTNFWCLQYIYKRLKFLGSKYYSQIGVLLFLSVWHGFHSGYYMSFFMEFVSVAVEKDVEAVLSRNEVFLEFISTPNMCKVKWIVLKGYILVFTGPCVAPLVLMSFPKWWLVLKNVYFFPHIVWILYPVYRHAVIKIFPPCKERKD